MHTKSDLRVVLKWMIYRSDSVITAVIQLNQSENSRMLHRDFKWQFSVTSILLLATGAGLLFGVRGRCSNRFAPTQRALNLLEQNQLTFRSEPAQGLWLDRLLWLDAPPRIVSVDFGFLRCNDHSMICKRLAALTTIKQITIPNISAFSVTDVEKIAQIRSIRSVRIQYAGVSDQRVNPLLSLPLTHFSVEGIAGISENDLQMLLRIPTLRSIDAANPRVEWKRKYPKIRFSNNDIET